MLSSLVLSVFIRPREHGALIHVHSDASDVSRRMVHAPLLHLFTLRRLRYYDTLLMMFRTVFASA